MTPTTVACPHDDDPLLCPPCQGPLDNRRTLPAGTLGATAHARYPGRCPHCADVIATGDRIRLTEHGWLHEDCAMR